ncbi:RNA-directed DNA polymerase (Reverse transcriptase), partial [Trifolium medium]|nr:RNA-directed DNA polymerase (Reverse transcriptase) [Trifolium medium]
MWHLRKSKESMIVQRSRAKWLREGDVNSSYFHACINSRRNQNAIRALQTENGWAETPPDIRQ